MKYLKYTMVDPISGHVIDPIMPAPNGRTHPSIAGLNVTFQFYDLGQICLATCNDVTIDSATGIVELTVDQYHAEISAGFSALREDVRKEIYNKAQDVRNTMISTWYHPSEIAFAVSVKVEEAVLATAAADDAAADVAAPNLHAEATARGITTKALATLVTAKFNSLRAAESKVAGNRGAKTDSIDAIAFNPADINACFTSLRSISENINNGWI